MKRIVLRRAGAAVLIACLVFALSATALAENDAPAITVDLPTSVGVLEGGTLSLSVGASGEELSFQWYKNDRPIDGATSSDYQETGLKAASDGARYYCYVQNPYGSAQTGVCRLTVVLKPEITRDINITSLTLTHGDTLTVTAQASGTNVQAQWYVRQDGGETRELAGQTSGTLILTATEEYNGADFFCRFFNEAGSADTSVCHVTVNPAPTPTPAVTAEPTAVPTATPALPPNITKNPVGEIVEEGGRAIFIARADDTRAYTWRFVSPDGNTYYNYNDSAVNTAFPGLMVFGGNTDTVVLERIPYEMNGWKAACLFTGAGGDSLSTGAVITVQKTGSALSIVSQPVGGTMMLEDDPDFVLSIQASSTYPGTFAYQWYSSKTNNAAAMQTIPGATGSTYAPEREEGTMYYRVGVTITTDGVTSEPYYSSIVPVTFTKPKVHEHAYSSVWEYNELSHWHQCTCGDHADEAFHTYEWTILTMPTQEQDGEQRGVCTVCGYETVQPIPAGSMTEETEQTETAPARRFTFGNGWMILLAVLAVAVIVGAAILIRRVLRSDDTPEETGEDKQEKQE